jgi:hypothetical protein
MANATRVASLLVVLLLTCGVGQAQHRWVGKDKHWYTDWLWWAGEGVIVTAFVLDAHSTALVRDRCPACREVNPFLGSHPSNRGIIIVSGIFFSIESGLHIASWEACPDPNREFKSWYIACDTTIPAITAAFRVPSAVHNYHLASRFPSTQSLSTTRFARVHSTNPSIGTNPWQVKQNSNPFSLPKRFSGCDRSLPLCSPFQPGTTSRPGPTSRIDLRQVHFRNSGFIAH